MPESNRDALLLEGTTSVQRVAADLEHKTLLAQDPPRQSPEVQDVDSYARYRVRNQIGEYYRPNSLRAEKRFQVLRGASLALGIIGVGLGAIASATRGRDVSVWAPVLTTVIASVTSFASAGKYEENAVIYAATGEILH